MKLLTSIDKIKKMASQRDEENRGFRSYLKDTGLPEERIDEEVEKLSKRITPRIDCRACANCCREVEPFLDDADVTRLAGALKLSGEQVKRDYLAPSSREGKLTFKVRPCPFLEGTRCAVYAHRPQFCRQYPNIFNQGLIHRLSGFIRHASICLIIYNILQALKREIWIMSGAEDHRKER